MTCIVGIRTKDNVFIGGDTLGSNGFTGGSNVRSKVFKKGNFLFGGCGSMRNSQLLEFSLTIPKINVDEKTEDYLYSRFVDAVRSCMKDGGALKLENNAEWMNGGRFLFAYDNRLFIMQGNFSITESTNDYSAVGSGEYHAQTSMYSTQDVEDPKERIKRAIICASNYVLSVNDKINIVSLNDEKKITKKKPKGKSKL